MSTERRPSEVITSLRWRAEQEKLEALKERNAASNQKKNEVTSTTTTTATKSALKNHSTNTKYCPSGHVMTTNMLLVDRQHFLQQTLGLPIDGCLPEVGCDACSADIVDEYIGGCCKICDLDFCHSCYNESGKSIQELLAEARENMIDYHNQQQQQLCSSSVEGSMKSFNSTQEFCASGHELVEVSTIVRQRYLQNRDGLSVLPIIECDCCSKQISKDFIAGCCMECDIDICKDCFKNGQSYEDVLEDRRGPPCDNNENENNVTSINESGGQRHNGRRPSYKGTGRVNYDDYPDPTVFQWTFTGSSKSQSVEYFQKDFGNELGMVKLDFYYTRGTVKTVLVHPTKGERVLFSKPEKISPQSYRKILKDPRSHNNRRYKAKEQRLLV